VILRAFAKKLTWIQAAEILGISARYLRRIKQLYEKHGFHALFDGRISKASPRRVPIETVEEGLRLYREESFDFNVQHFHEKLVERHRIEVGYIWIKCLLQAASLVAKDNPRKKHVTVYQHFDETISLGFGAHAIDRYAADGEPLKEKIEKSRKKQLAVLPEYAKHQTGEVIYEIDLLTEDKK
jgi:Homeodomain-like domain